MPPRVAKRTVSELQSHAGYWLRLVSNQVSHGFATRVESRGVTVAEWVVMRALYSTPKVNPSELAETLGLTRGAISKLVDRLAAKGLVACKADRDDKRYMTVALTRKGSELVPTLAALADENDREFFGELSEVEMRALVEILKGVARRRGITASPIE